VLARLGRRFFGFDGRISRAAFWSGFVALMVACLASVAAAERLWGNTSALLMSPPLLWAATALSVKRLHDVGRSAAWLLLALVPLVGPLCLVLVLGLRRGTPGENRYGADPLAIGGDYLTVQSAPGSDAPVIEDVTRLSPVTVSAVFAPTSVGEVQEVIRRQQGPISIGGGRFSMGGQTASPGSLHLDMRRLNRVLEFSPARRTIRVEAGIRWCDIQRFVDPHGLAVKIMQTYANFTVGGSLSVNVHGRYVGQGPIILSVRAVKVVLMNGEAVEATNTRHADLFYGAVGGYGGLGVIVEAELDLAENTRGARVAQARHPRLPGPLPGRSTGRTRGRVPQRRPVRPALLEGAGGDVARNAEAGDDRLPAAASPA
jgi:uncharacterized membrane protein YhaH (DUF805 family)